MWRNNLDIQKKALLLHSVFETDGSLAQLVEHIPFKDGVLGSSPKRATNTKAVVFQLPFLLSGIIRRTRLSWSESLWNKWIIILAYKN